MQLTPDNARARLLDLFLAQENCRQQLKAIEAELRDVRNYIAGIDAVTPEAEQQA